MTDTLVSKGIITYMYLENFVTYSSVAIKPGRYLNIIIGPNGTGKSTIVCAIVLGLGGKPATLGRAPHLSDYVKTGCQEAKIVIHLKNDEFNDVVITRIITIHGGTTWLINEKPSNHKGIQELTKSFNIQIDNLCQFLPQDKVQDFSKMNAQELLQNTERSVGDPIIFQHHKQLMTYRSEQQDLQSQVASKKKVLETKIQIHDGLKQKVATVKERKLIKKKIVALEQKRAWILYDQLRRELLKLKEKKDEALKNMKSLEDEIKPINDAIEKIRGEVQILKNSVLDHKNKVYLKNAKVQKILNNILECDGRIAECENECKDKIALEEARDDDINAARQQKNKLVDDLSLVLQDIESEEMLIKKRQEIQSLVEKQRNVINELTNRISSLQQEEKRAIMEIRGQESELELLNINTKRLHLLREKSIDAYKGVLWLRENRDKFSGRIHEPMLLSINVKDVQYAKYLENVIAFRDLIAFVCENVQDMNLFLRYLRDEQNLQVNAVHSDPNIKVSLQPSIPLENIRQFGFTHYLASLIEAPGTIMKYLVTIYNLNNIPVGTDLVDDNMDNIPDDIRFYFSQTHVYGVKISKYTGDRSTVINSVYSSKTLSIVLDRSKILKVEEQLKELRERKNNIGDCIKQIEQQVHEENKVLDKYRVDRNKCQQDLQQVQAVKRRISMIETKIKELEDERTSTEQIRETYCNKIKRIMERQLNIYKEYNLELEECFQWTTKNEQVEFALKLQSRLLRRKTSDSEDLREKLKTAEDQFRKIGAEVAPLKNEVQQLYNEALEKTNGLSPSDKGFAPINAAFNKLPPTIEQISTELHVAQAKVFCLGNNADAESVLREYDAIKEDIKKLEEFIQEKTAFLETTGKEMEVIRDTWLKNVTELIEKINANFSKYFSDMECAGEVAVVPGENPLDFAQYGLKIKVKFRDTDQLQELTRHHQSGGERAVTTAIYMISLQGLSRVPFRCVDEINQGMDAVNERRVLNLLMKITGRPNSSQYFLITPKLVSGLEYTETVTVHCVFNGPFVISHKDFDTDEYIEHLRNVRQRRLVEN